MARASTGAPLFCSLFLYSIREGLAISAKRKLHSALLTASFLLSSHSIFSQANPPGKSPLTLDDAFNSVEFSDVQISPSGDAVAIATSRADWEHERFREDLWLYRGGSLIQLTRSGHDSSPKWSPDGKWIAFLSDRAAPEPDKSTDLEEPKAGKEKEKQIYLISVQGGEAFPATNDRDGIHSFAWAPAGNALFYSMKEPWTKKQRDDYKEQWKDVLQYREADRGDVIARISLEQALKNAAQLTELAKKAEQKQTANPKQQKEDKDKDAEPEGTPGAERIAQSRYAISELAIHNGSIAYVTAPPSSRVESTKDFEVYIVPASGGTPKQITNNQGVESKLRWSPDGKLFCLVGMGSVEGKYEDVQPRLYELDLASGKPTRWGKSFSGAISSAEPAGGNVVLANTVIGTQQPIYSFSGDVAKKLAGVNGTYSNLSVAPGSKKIAFVYTTQQKPPEVYLADSAEALSSAKPISDFNADLARRDLPQGEPTSWKSKDGTNVEGWLLYPPGKFHAKNLRMLTLIHGGPGDADGDRFGANWYDWAVIAASDGWLVFRPNYRGSIGYGDKFQRDIAPRLVSLPGEDILAGVDALVREGIADPNHLAVSGYSYGGYMTNWLLTQTTRFKSAATGAGAVEHAVNWGNDDLTFDDAWFLGGDPWQAEQNYNSEAAMWHLDKIKTPTHIVGGSDDIRVYIGEQYLLERALHTLGVPSSLLIFPGEGHPLAVNPWHGKIKVREELRWIDHYDAGQR